MVVSGLRSRTAPNADPGRGRRAAHVSDAQAAAWGPDGSASQPRDSTLCRRPCPAGLDRPLAACAYGDPDDERQVDEHHHTGQKAEHCSMSDATRGERATYRQH